MESSIHSEKGTTFRRRPIVDVDDDDLSPIPLVDPLTSAINDPLIQTDETLIVITKLTHWKDDYVLIVWSNLWWTHWLIVYIGVARHNRFRKLHAGSILISPTCQVWGCLLAYLGFHGGKRTILFLAFLVPKLPINY